MNTKRKTITKRPGRITFGVLSALMVVAMILVPTLGALAVHDAGLFELDVRAGVDGDQKKGDPIPPLVGDGNTVDDPNVAGDDWATIYADYMDGTPAGDNSDAFAISWTEDTFANNPIVVADKPWIAARTPEVSFFTGGGSKDTNGIQDGPWLYDTVNDVVPDKNDIVNAFAAAYEKPNGETTDTYLYFGLDTYSVNGDSNVGFWFFRQPVGLQPLAPGATTGRFYGQHYDGDLFVAAAYTQGGTVGTIEVYRWSGDDATGELVLLASGQDCATAGANDMVCGVINKLLPGETFGEDPIFDYANTNVANNPNLATSYQYESAAFVEFGLNLNALLGQDFGCYTSFLGETRSSQSPTAQLKDFAFGEFKVCGIEVTKTGDTLGKATDPVDYTVTIENTGRVTLYKRNISDTLLGSITYNGADQTNPYVLSNTCGASLAPHESCTITLRRTVEGSDPDPLPNTVTALYSEYADFTGLEFTDDDDHSVNLFQPAVMIDKTGDALSKIGDPVTYTFTITNMSSEDSPDLELASITDDVIGDLMTQATAAGCDVLTYNEVCSFSVTRTVAEGDGDPLENTVDVLYHPDGFTNNITASYGHAVNLFQPDVEITKSGNTLSKIGDPVTYTFKITNTSSDDSPNLVLDSIMDDVLGDLASYATAAGCDSLPPDDPLTTEVIEGVCEFDVPWTVAAVDVYPADGKADDPVINTVTIHFHPAGFPNDITATASHTLNLFQPSITFDKWADTELSKVGDDVNYTLTLNNTSSPDTPDLTCTIVDTVLGVNDEVTLASGEGHVIDAAFTVPGTVSDPYTNNASVMCTVGGGFGNMLNAGDSWTVNLFQPSVTIEKTGDTLSKLGDEVTYHFKITNTSSSDSPVLKLQSVSDDVLGSLLDEAVAAGCDNLAPAAICEFDVDWTVDAVDLDLNGVSDDPIVNTVTVLYHPLGFPNEVTDWDDHSLNLFQPAINLTKSAETLSKAGDPVEYTITLYNNSSADAPDMVCTITDATLDFSEEVTLASGANAPYTVPFTIPADFVGDDFVNTASVICSPTGFPNTYTDEASHSIELFQPAVAVTKTGDAQGKIGDPVDYTITLSNNSSADTPAMNCTAEDTLLGVVFNGVLPFGDTVLNLSRTVLETDPDQLVNSVTLICSPDGYPNVFSDSASWTTDLFQPAVAVTKTGDAQGKIGDPVDYVITLTNNSSADTPDMICMAEDTLLGVVFDGVLPFGDTVLNLSRTVLETDPDQLVNTVSLTCSPDGYPNVFSAEASWTTDLFQPSINIVKTGPDYGKNWGGQADEITYFVTITNTSSDDTPNLSLVSYSDSLVPGVVIPVEAGCDDLMPGDSCEFSYTFTPTVEQGALDELVNTFEAIYNPGGFPNEITDNDGSNTWTVDLIHPSFTVEKACASTEPIPQEGPAVFDITITNTGDADLVVTADEYMGEIILPAGSEPFTFQYTVNGPFSGQETVDNTVNASWALDTKYGLSNTGSASASASCRVGSQLDVIKLSGPYGSPFVDPTKDFVFELYTGPDGFDAGTLLASDSTLNDQDGVLDFGNLNLDRYQTYTLCERNVPAGWSSFWRVDTDNDGIVDTTIVPYNPDADDPVPQTLGNYCVDFGPGTGLDLLVDGGTLVFQVENTYPGGAPRTPGYWKNWNRCTGGGQAQTAADNGGWEEGYWLLEDVLDPNIGGGIVWDDMLPDDFVFPITSCELGVAILGALDYNDGTNRNSDAAYTLAKHLFAAQLNFGAGAQTCQAAQDAALAGEALLDRYNFNAEGPFLASNNDATKADYTLALTIAKTLDRYNNELLCVAGGGPLPIMPPAVSITSPANGSAVEGASVSITASAFSEVGVSQVEFFVNGSSIGVDAVAADGWTATWNLTGLADGVYTLSATATATDWQTGSSSITVTVDNVKVQTLLSSLSGVGKKAPDNKTWYAEVTITIQDAGGNLVDGAVVSGKWSNSKTVFSCTTGVDGKCTLTVTGLSLKAVKSITFTITGVGKDGYIFDPALSQTTITVNRP